MMNRQIFLFYVLMLCAGNLLNGQVKVLDNFYGKSQSDEDICLRSGNYTNDVSVEKLILQIVEAFGVKKLDFTVIRCDGISNVMSTISSGKLFLLYNTAFLKSIKSFDFKTDSLSTNKVDWVPLHVLTHEIAHLLNGHFVNPSPKATMHDLELEADETAGFILQRLGATLEESQQALKSDLVSIEGNSDYPPRVQRLEANRKGWEKAGKSNH